RSILTWDDLVSKFINHFFPPSKTTNLRNEISNFQQRFDESFYDAWDRFKDLLRACPHHGFTELHQLDTFYNGLNPSDQDSLNSAAGGNLLERSTQGVLRIIENMTSAMTTMFKQHQVIPTPASLKAVEESCVTCVSFSKNTAIFFVYGITPKHTIANLKDEPKVHPVGCEMLKALPSLSNKEKLLQVSRGCSKYDRRLAPANKTMFTFLADFVIVDYESDPRVPLILGRPFLRTAHALIDVYEEELILRDSEERLILNMKHGTSSYSNKHQIESINIVEN
ncbi:reverse transcriptase domain-containing protein, partial [Tanacetum coccineum]